MQSKVGMEIETETDSNLVREMILICVENRCGTAQPSRHIFLISTQPSTIVSTTGTDVGSAELLKMANNTHTDIQIAICCTRTRKCGRLPDLQLIWGLLSVLL